MTSYIHQLITHILDNFSSRQYSKLFVSSMNKTRSKIATPSTHEDLREAPVLVGGYRHFR